MKQRFLVSVLLLPITAWSEPVIKEEVATTRMPLEKPEGQGVFGLTLTNFREDLLEDTVVDWDEVDQRIDQWFENAKTKFPVDFKKNADKWEELRIKTQQEARETLAPIEDAWKQSANKACDGFLASEKGFYDAKPQLLIRGTYRYHEGQRERSGVVPAWTIDPAVPENVKLIEGTQSHDTGEVMVKASGMAHPIFRFQASWKVFMHASPGPASPEVRAIGRIASPEISAWVTPFFEGEHGWEITKKFFNEDAVDEKIGPVRITVGNSAMSGHSGITVGFKFPALTDKQSHPILRAGQ